MIETGAPPQMATIPTASPNEPYFKLFREHAGKARLLSDVERTFLRGIELFAGRECRGRCERSGLANLHLHYPAEYVHLLEAYVNHRLKRRMLAWSAAIGRQDVGLRADFLVQDLLVVRVHYPHSHIGKSSGPAGRPRLHHRLRYGLSAALEKTRDAYDSKSALRLPKKFWEYSRQRRRRAALPLPYRCHAPHLDSWLGQPVSSLSVWLAIAGVDRDNSMCLYPETAGARLPLSGSQFLGSGVRLPRPTRPEIQDGDLFVFSTDILHSSQLNVSDKTRIALTTRIDPGTPVFARESLWFVQRWYSADGILQGRWQRKIFRASEHSAPRPVAAAAASTNGEVTIPVVFVASRRYRIGPSDLIPRGGKMAVQFANKRILIVRTGEGDLRAFSARCPHEGYRMDEGYHDECILSCPGHGLEFDARTGRSPIDRYRLARFAVSETSGAIFLGSPE